MGVESPHDNSRVCFNEQAATERGHTSVNEPGFTWRGEVSGMKIFHPQKSQIQSRVLLMRGDAIAFMLLLYYSASQAACCCVPNIIRGVVTVSIVQPGRN